MLWAPKCASRLPWRGHAFPHQPSSSYLFLIGFFFFLDFLKIMFLAFADVALRTVLSVALAGMIPYVCPQKMK